MRNNKAGIGCVVLPAIIIIFSLTKGEFGGAIVWGIILFIVLAFLCGSEEESTESYENKAEQPLLRTGQKNNNVLSDSQKEELKSLIDTFEAYMSKPFPDRHLFPYSAFFDDFWRVIGKIGGYDFECGWEKGRQLEDKIKAHNKALAKRSRQKKSSQNINQEEFTDKIANDFNDKIKYQKSNEVAGEDSRRQRIADLVIEDDDEEFIEKHLPEPVFNDVSGYSLNDEQKSAILCDSKYNLVLAGAGTGKTLTICGKIQYLLENNLAKEEDILVLSYLDTSVDELNEKLSKKYPNLVVKTFHGLGSDILSEHYGEKKAVDDQLLAHIKAFFDENYDKNTELRDTVEKYLSLSPRYPYFLRDFTSNISQESVDKLIEEFRSTDFKILSEALKSSRSSSKSKKLLTIKKESVKSLEELMIANYLFVNGIRYEYERPYEFKTATMEKRQYCPDFYLPKYKIYIEHFGINKAGRAGQYSPDEEQEYLQTKEWKEKTHDEHKTICVKTYSYEFSKKTVFANLKKNLEDQGVKFRQRWTQNWIKDLRNAVLNLYDGRDLSQFMYILESALHIYRTEWVGMKWKQYSDEQEKERIRSFIAILKEIDSYYSKVLKNKIDFDKMILEATRHLQKSKFKDKYRYKYILIDEFHDIPPSIFNFLEELVEHGNSKLMAVGDNRQYKDKFNNSDISIIWDFKDRNFPNVVINKLTTIYKREETVDAPDEENNQPSTSAVSHDFSIIYKQEDDSVEASKNKPLNNNVKNIDIPKKSTDVVADNEYIELSSPVGNIFMIEKNPSNEEFNWEGAMNYAKKLRKGGFSDWRLPTTEELRLIYRNEDKFDRFAKKIFSGRTYWTSSTVADSSKAVAWYKYLDSYFKTDLSKDTECYVICVR